MEQHWKGFTLESGSSNSWSVSAFHLLITRSRAVGQLKVQEGLRENREEPKEYVFDDRQPNNAQLSTAFVSTQSNK